MAFGGTELRLILSLRSYGTTHLARLRRDITALSAATRAANVSQMQVQEEIIRLTNRRQNLLNRITRLETQIAGKKIALEHEAQKIIESGAAKRHALLVKEHNLTTRMQGLRLKMLKEEAELRNAGVMQRGGRFLMETRDAAGRFSQLTLQGKKGIELAQEQMRLQMRTADIHYAISAQRIKELEVTAKIHRNSATQLDTAKKLLQVTGAANIEEARLLAMQEKSLLAQAAKGVPVELSTETLEMVAALERYEAAVVDAQRLDTIMKEDLPRNTRKLERQLELLRLEDELIQTKKVEQLAALRQQIVQYNQMVDQVQMIDQQLARVRAEMSSISDVEARSNEKLNHKLRILRQEEDRLVDLREKADLYAQKIAEAEGPLMKQAILMDRIFMEQQRFQQLETVGRTISHIGTTAQFAGLLTTAAFTGMSHSFANFNRQTVQTATQMRDIGAPITQVAERAKDLEDLILFGRGEMPAFLERFPATAVEMSESAYDLFSSLQLLEGNLVDVEKGFRMLEAANKVAVAGNVDLREATSALITILNNFDPQMRRVNEQLDTMFDIVRFGRMRISEFNEMLNKVAPAAKDVGLSLEDVGGMMAFLTEVVPSQARASTMIARFLETFVRPDMARGLRQVGIEVNRLGGGLREPVELVREIIDRFPELRKGQVSVSQFFQIISAVGRARGLPKDMRDLKSIMDAIQESGQAIPKGVLFREEARRALRLLINGFEEFETRQRQIIANRGEFEAAFDAMKEAPGIQWQIMLNQLRAIVLVVGREVLPVFIKLLEKVADWVNKFKQLDEATRNNIIRWAALASVGLVLGGTVLNITGSLIAFYANLRLIALASKAANASLFGTATILSGLVNLLRTLAVIGVVSIALRVMWKGDASAIDFLLGSLAGGIVGSRFGPVGAVLGAITVPIVLKVMTEKPLGTQLAEQIREGAQGASPALRAYSEYVAKALEGASASEVKSIKDRLLTYEEYTRVVKGGYDRIRDAHDRMIKETKGQDLADRIRKTFEELESSSSKEMRNFIDRMFDAKEEAEKVNKEIERLRKQIEDIKARAFEEMQRKIESAADSLANLRQEFVNFYKRALGPLFEGPTLTGIFGEMFSGINDMLRQFGVQIAVPFALIERDLDQQMMYFERWRKGIDKLLDRGIPRELVEEIRQLGPTAIPLIEGLLGASPRQLRAYIRRWRQIHAEIERLAKRDMDRQLAEWEKHGKNIMWQIINGIAKSPAHARLRETYKKYVTDVFGEILQKEMQKEIDEAIREAEGRIKELQTGQKDIAKAVKKGEEVEKAAVQAEDTRLWFTPIKDLTRAQAMRQIKLAQRRMAMLREGGLTEDERELYRRLRRRVQALRQRAYPDYDRPGSRGVPDPRRLTIYNDNVTINANGASPDAVMRALRKHRFQMSTKRR